MQGAAGSLDMVFQFLAAFIGAIAKAHGSGPDPARDTAHDRVLRIHAAGEKERQVVGEVIHCHAAGQVGFNKGKAVGQVKASWEIGFAPASAIW